MRQIQAPPPNLFRSSGPYRSWTSKDAVPRNHVQRIGLFVIGAVHLTGGITITISTVFFRTELTAQLHSVFAGAIASIVLVSLVLVGGVVVSVLGVRLLKTAFRQARNAPSHQSL